MKFIYRVALVLIPMVPLEGAAQNLTVFPGAKIQMTASATSYGQLFLSTTNIGGAIVNNTGTISQEQYIAKTSGYVCVSSPMQEDFLVTSGNNNQMFYYDGETYQWRTSHQKGRGYFAKIGIGKFSPGAEAFSVQGTPNVALMIYQLEYKKNTAVSGSGSGWNLVGNPYTCGLDWAAVTHNGVDDAFYIWDPGTSSYLYYAPNVISGKNAPTLSSVIPPMQSFYVKAQQVVAKVSGANPTLSFDLSSSGTVKTISPYLSKTNPDNFILGVVALADSSTNDAMWIVDNTAAREGFDGEHDAWKMYNGATQPNIYSVFKGEEMAINALDFVNTRLIPVGFDGPTKGTYAISLEQIVNSVTYKITLEDKHLDLFYDISSKDYTFKNIGWDSEEPRFALHVEHFNVMDVDENDSSQTDNSYYVYQDQQLIYVDQSEEGIFDSYILYGLDGRLISNGSITNQLQSIQAPRSSGMYILVLQGAQSSERVKINITK